MTHTDSVQTYKTQLDNLLDDWGALVSIAPSQAMARADTNEKKIALLSSIKNAHPLGRLTFLTQTAAGVHNNALRVLSETLSHHETLKDFITYGLTELQVPKFAAWAYKFSKENMINVADEHFHGYITAMSDRHKSMSDKRTTLYPFGATNLHALIKEMVSHDAQNLSTFNKHGIMIAISYKIGFDLDARFKARGSIEGDEIEGDEKSPLIEAIKNDDMLNDAFSMAHRHFVHYQQSLTTDDKLRRGSNIGLDNAVHDLIQDYNITYGVKPRLIIQSDDSRGMKPSSDNSLKNA